MNDFRDQIYINQIREKLWTQKQYGRAAVMVGAGFSRNSSIDSHNQKFPLWKDLRIHFLKKLGQETKSYKEKDVAILASEVEASFSTNELNTIIKKNIPDSKFEPSRLHELLLKLPWSDVFTTNYDTLLEEAAKNIDNKKFDPIYKTTDIPGKTKPRIIKLHGSFPSYTPFIITKEHYRTYPYKFAPFVNLVQQSIMENAFCLFGFSGDDPNFLRWIGWVRDNLGTHKTPIYLCGVLDLEESERNLLKRRGIRPVDLGLKFHKTKYDSIDERHYKANEWLLNTLHVGAPPRKNKWPNYEKPSLGYEPTKIPEIEKSQLSDLAIVEKPNLREYISKSDIKPKHLLDLINYWKIEEQEYPGWIVAPIRVRSRVWRYFNDHITRILESGENLPWKLHLYLSYQVVWRLNLCLYPPIDSIIPLLEEILEQENPETLTENTNPIKISKSDLKHAWSKIALAILNYFREKQNVEKFNYWKNKIEDTVNRNRELSYEYKYILCQNFLSKLDYDSTLELVNNWDVSTSSPEWLLKKASVLIELGSFDKARSILEKLLITVRASFLDNKDDFHLYSAEGICLFLLRNLRLVMDISNAANNLGTVFDRFDELKEFLSNPHEEIKQLRYDVITNEVNASSNVTRKKSFDPKKRSTSWSFGSNINYKSQTKSYNYLRLYYEGGFPFKAPGIQLIDKESLEKTIQNLSYQEDRWIFNVLLRYGDKDLLNNWLDRVRVATTDSSDADYLIEILLNSFEKSLKKLERENKKEVLFRTFLEKQIQVSAQLLSYFTIRLSEDELKRLLDLAMKFYNQTLIHQLSHFYDKYVTNLFQRLIFVLNFHLDSNILYELLSTKIVGEKGFDLADEDQWPKIFLDVTISNSNNQIKLTKKLENRIDELINIIKENYNGKARRRAIMRITYLYESNLLKQVQVNSFRDALWKHRSQDTGFPKDCDLYKNYLLNLPEPENINIKELFTNYLKEKKLDKINISSFGGPPTNAKLFHVWLYSTRNFISFDSVSNSENLLLIDTELYNNISKKYLNWWNNGKETINVARRKQAFIPRNKAKEAYQQSTSLFGAILVSQINDQKVLEKLFQIKNEMDEYGLYTHHLLPCFYRKNIISKEELVNKIRSSINSVDNKEIIYSFESIRYWINLNLYHNNDIELPDALFSELIRFITFIRENYLLLKALELINWILAKDILLHSKSKRGELLMALKHLFYKVELPNNRERLELLSQNVDNKNIKNLPDIFSESSKLSSILFEYYNTDSSEELPDILEKWKAKCLESILPEVRQFWR